jgi:predicted transcriptional regulator
MRDIEIQNKNAQDIVRLMTKKNIHQTKIGIKRMKRNNLETQRDILKVLHNNPKGLYKTVLMRKVNLTSMSLSQQLDNLAIKGYVYRETLSYITDNIKITHKGYIRLLDLERFLND